MTKEDYMKLSKERLAELLVERDSKPAIPIAIEAPRLSCYETARTKAVVELGQSTPQQILNNMTLKEYLTLIVDEEVRVELEIETEGEDDYLYKSFWLSDFRIGYRSEYSDWTVGGVSFIPEKDSRAEISIHITP